MAKLWADRISGAWSLRSEAGSPEERIPAPDPTAASHSQGPGCWMGGPCLQRTVASLHTFGSGKSVSSHGIFFSECSALLRAPAVCPPELGGGNRQWSPLPLGGWGRPGHQGAMPGRRSSQGGTGQGNQTGRAACPLTLRTFLGDACCWNGVCVSARPCRAGVNAVLLATLTLGVFSWRSVNQKQFAAWEDLPSLENRLRPRAGPASELGTPLQVRQVADAPGSRARGQVLCSPLPWALSVDRVQPECGFGCCFSVRLQGLNVSKNELPTFTNPEVSCKNLEFRLF